MKALILALAMIATPAAAAPFQATLLTPAEQQSVAGVLAPLRPAEARPADWIDDSQSFHIVSDQPGLRDTYLVTVSADLHPPSVHDWQMSASFVLIDRVGGAKTVLPQHPVMNWSAYEVEAVAFRDVRGDGSRAILIDVQGVTGIGENGATPFDVWAVYVPGAGGFRLDDGLQKKLDGAKSLSDAVRISRAYFHAG